MTEDIVLIWTVAEGSVLRKLKKKEHIITKSANSSIEAGTA